MPSTIWSVIELLGCVIRVFWSNCCLMTHIELSYLTSHLWIRFTLIYIYWIEKMWPLLHYRYYKDDLAGEVGECSTETGSILATGLSYVVNIFSRSVYCKRHVNCLTNRVFVVFGYPGNPSVESELLVLWVQSVGCIFFMTTHFFVHFGIITYLIDWDWRPPTKRSGYSCVLFAL